MDSAQEQRIQYEQRIQRITTNEWILIFVNGYCCCYEVTENMNCITSQEMSRWLTITYTRLLTECWYMVQSRRGSPSCELICTAQVVYLKTTSGVSNEPQNNEPTDHTLSSRSRVLHWSRQLILLKIENDNINEFLIILIELCDNILGI